MIFTGLTSEEQLLADHILAHDLASIMVELINSKNATGGAKQLLHQINSILQYIGQLWTQEHDMQGKLLVQEESISSDTINSMYSTLKPLFELIRSRLPILRSEYRIAVSTLVNIHGVSELVELKMREIGFLTYYWGTQIKLKEIKDKQETSPANIFIFSCMAVNSELNCFEELKKIRKAYPEMKIIVGGAAFPMFLLLKTEPNHPALSLPYKDQSYLNEIKSSKNLKDFVKKVFEVDYCETYEEIIEQIEKKS